MTRQLGKVELRGSETDFSYRCDAMAYSSAAIAGLNIIQLVSFAGPATSVKAMTAALRSKRSRQFDVRVHDVDQLGSYMIMRADPEGYNVYHHRLSRYDVQAMMISRRPGLLTTIDDESLWQVLKGDLYTTPLLRHWMPWIRRHLKDTNGLRPLPGFGCEPGLLTVSQEDLDNTVAHGIQQGRLTFEDDEPCLPTKNAG